MARAHEDDVIDWLFDNAGPIIRYRVAVELRAGVPESQQGALFQAVLDTREAQRWLANLGGRQIHGSKDTHVENAVAKLVEYGFRVGVPVFDEKMSQYVGVLESLEPGWNRDILASFLIAAGFHDQHSVHAWFEERLAALHATAEHGNYFVYLTPAAAAAVPTAWRGKPIYRDEFDPTGSVYPLPTCYNLYALAHFPARDERTRSMMEDVVAYLSHPRFQTLPGGYIWDRSKRRCYAAGRVFLACANEERLVLFLELAARFRAARSADWFIEAVARLEAFQTDAGTYFFPTGYLKENRDSYYLYAGAHMGLGEDRRQRSWREIESTFRMLRIKRLLSA